MYLIENRTLWNEILGMSSWYSDLYVSRYYFFKWKIATTVFLLSFFFAAELVTE